MAPGKLIAAATKVLAELPSDIIADVISVIRAIADGRGDVAARLAKNAALARAAKLAARERIKRTR